MRSLFSVLFILILHSSTFTQEYKISRGDIKKDRIFLMDKTEITVNDKKGNFISIRPQKDNGVIYNYYIEFFENLNFKDRIEIKNDNKIKILKVFIKNNKTYIFIKEKISNGFLLRIDLININTKQIAQRNVLEIDKDITPNIYKSIKKDLNIYLEHSSKIILTIPFVEDKKTNTLVKVFSNSIEEIEEENIYPDKTISFKNTNFLTTLQHNNKVYLIYNIVFNDGRKIYRIIELSSGNSKRTLDIPVTSDTYELLTSTIKNQQLIISGLFSNKKKNRFQGTTNYIIDLESFSIISSKQNRFLNLEVSKYFNGLFKKNRSLDIKNILVDDDLNIYLVFQFYKVKKQSIPLVGLTLSYGSSVFLTYYPIKAKYKLYDDLLFCKINNESDLEWDKVLHFEQLQKISSKSNKRDSSVYSFLFNNKLNLLINSYINTKKDKIIIKQDRNFGRTKFYNISLNNDGKISLREIFSNAKSKIIHRADKTLKYKNHIFNLGQGNMRKQLIKIELQ